MFIRDVFIGSLLAIFGYASAACANSCANLDVLGSFDESGLRESEYGIYAAGTFRIAGEGDESKQPMFNLATVNCEKQLDDMGRASLECKVTKAIVRLNQVSRTQTSQIVRSISTLRIFNEGASERRSYRDRDLHGLCYNTILTIDRNTKRVYMSFTRTKYADNYDKIRLASVVVLPRTQVLMNCTGWPRIRKKAEHRRVTVISVAPATSRTRGTVFLRARPAIGLRKSPRHFCSASGSCREFKNLFGVQTSMPQQGVGQQTNAALRPWRTHQALRSVADSGRVRRRLATGWR